MSLAAFNQLMTHTINVIKRERDGSGDFSTLATYSESGFVEHTNKLITTEKGEEVLITSIVFLKSDSDIDISHPYWLLEQTAPYTRENMQVVQIDPIDDPRTGKTHHYECLCK